MEDRITEIVFNTSPVGYGSVLAVGKGNPEWNYSAPHGAGRVMSRGNARRKINGITVYQMVLSVNTYDLTMQKIV